MTKTSLEWAKVTKSQFSHRSLDPKQNAKGGEELPRFQVARLFRKPIFAGVLCASLAVANIAVAERHVALDPRALCDQAAQDVARKSGVPVALLKALTRTETGIKKNGAFGPWAWTVNMEGKGVWFDSLDAAKSYVFKHFKRGARSFDVGCFQINYRWHHQHFKSLEEMFEPVQNAEYAAQFLLRLKKEFGTWDKAVGAYHSRTPEHAERYTRAYRSHLASVKNQPAADRRSERSTAHVPDAVRTRENSYPLLQSGDGKGLSGSLFAARNARGESFFLAGRPLVGVKP